MAGETTVLHLFLINSIGGSTAVFLLETEPGVVEFPRLTLATPELDSEEALSRRVREATGMDIEVSGFLDPPPDSPLEPAGSRILLARLVAGSPHVTVPHVGWEWTSGSELVRMPFAPRIMVNELKSFMNV
ncbi:MAG: hypothetical protein HYX51_05045 [Chloroflexi bacterium]|nr:hypothetical protein [Chloroflexota bacterium]